MPENYRFMMGYEYQTKKEEIYKLLIWGLCVSKDAEFNVDFKNIHLLW
jgi:hypothetical protein